MQFHTATARASAIGPLKHLPNGLQSESLDSAFSMLVSFFLMTAVSCSREVAKWRPWVCGKDLGRLIHTCIKGVHPNFNVFRGFKEKNEYVLKWGRFFPFPQTCHIRKTSLFWRKHFHFCTLSLKNNVKSFRWIKIIFKSLWITGKVLEQVN